MSFYGESITQLATATTYDPATGETYVERWKGTPAQVVAKDLVYRGYGYRTQIDVNDDGGYWTVTAYGGNVESDVWEFDSNDIERSLWSLPVVKAQFDTLADPGDAVWIRADIESALSGSPVYDEDGNLITTDVLNTVLGWITASGLSSTVFKNLAASLADGVETYPDSQTVLRKDILANGLGVRAARTNVNKLFTTPVLIAAENIPSDISEQLSVGWWLKRSPRCSRTSYGQWRVLQEYYFAESYNVFSLSLAT